ncbi:MAG: UDP-N-acetylmuramoyl-L-alanine--D-glutamate ligase [Actinobacteria bacterium]|nr:UDP-N-acetylmuramoyl-L-alanine--D-glutamate ligase [Actinomycetota bacterium]
MTTDGTATEQHPAPHFGSVCVLGLGKSGLAVARYCLESLAALDGCVSSLTLYAGARTAEGMQAAAPFIAEGIEVIFDDEEVVGHYDTCVVSPGISMNSTFYISAQAASAVIMSEPEFAYLLSPENWIAITGTNGKTTTTALCAYLLNESNIEASAVGNIGDPCITAVRDRQPGRYLVAELSSYQLASTHGFSPRAAVLLNITPDHLSWHGSHQAYIDAKMKVFSALAQDALAVVDISTPDAALCAEKLKDRDLQLLTIDTSRNEVLPSTAGCVGGVLTVRFGEEEPIVLCAVSELSIKGEHNVINALAAAACALFCGADTASVIRGLKRFAPLEHRIEPCGMVDGVAYYNDSKATNTDAVLKALTSFDEKPLIVLLGGKDKGTDLRELVEACASRCKAVVCYGASRERFLAAFADSAIEVLEGDHLVDALQVARAHACPGDVVLLSPACASFDEFNSFEHRGESFKTYVAAMQGDHS